MLQSIGPLSLRRFCSAIVPPFDGTVDLVKLASLPLEELRRRSEARGLCDGDGNRIKGAPWGMSLAHNTASAAEPWPTVRTVGFLRVTPDCFTFLLRRRKKKQSSDLPISVAYVEGKYRAGEICEQWRCEGIAKEVGQEAAASAPAASFAQIIASASAGEERRQKITNRDTFLNDVENAKVSLETGTTTQKTIENSIVVFECQPVRVELLIGGPDFSMWERVEWKRAVDGDVDSDWLQPQKLMPY